jgi:hypothetical protein
VVARRQQHQGMYWREAYDVGLANGGRFGLTLRDDEPVVGRVLSANGLTLSGNATEPLC